MDKDSIESILAGLRARLKRVEEAITKLESMDASTPIRSRRGRKSMGAEERQEVSKRIRQYWATRHANQSNAGRV